MDGSSTEKYCGMCCQTLPIDSFHLRSAYANDRQSNCKECRRNASASRPKPAKLSTDEVMSRFTEKDFYESL